MIFLINDTLQNITTPASTTVGPSLPPTTPAYETPSGGITYLIPYIIVGIIAIVFTVIVICSLFELICCCDKGGKSITLSRNIRNPTGSIANDSILPISTNMAIRDRVASSDRVSIHPPSVKPSSASMPPSGASTTLSGSPGTTSTALKIGPSGISKVKTEAVSTQSASRTSRHHSGAFKVAPPAAQTVATTANIIGKILTFTNARKKTTR